MRSARLAKHGFERLLALGLLVLLLLVRFWDPLPLQVLRLKTFDYFQVLKPRPSDSQPVVIVDIDERSLKLFGQWPWSRLRMADLVSRIGEAGAVSIGIDILFPEQDRMSPQLVADELHGISEATKQLLRQLPDNDTVFAEAIRKHRVVLAHSGLGSSSQSGAFTDVKSTPVVILGADPKPYLRSLPKRLANLAVLEQAAAGRGLVTIIPELDGVVRRVPSAMVIQDAIVPTMAIELLRVAVGAPSITIRTDEHGIQRLILGRAAISTDSNGLVWLNVRRHDPSRFISAADVLAGNMAKPLLKGKIVLVGTSSTGLFDQKPTAVDPAVPGVEIHAQLIENIISGSSLIRPRFAPGIELVLTAVTCLAMILIVPIYGPRLVFPIGLAVSATVVGLTWQIFDSERILIDPWFPLLSSIAVFWLLVLVNYLREEKERMSIRNAFGRYISSDVIDQLSENPDRLVLGGEKRELTIMFCDARKFTSVSERFKDDPQGLTRLINGYLTPLSKAILERRGTIDKYIGDAIMAFWNAPANVPSHAAQACDSALEMLARLETLNSKLIEEASAEGRTQIPIKVGIGINTGICVVGNLGSDLRFDYSALGDAVNLASRLEGLTKQYQMPVLVGEKTVQGSSGYAFIEADLIRVVGKDEPERIFALVGDARTAESQAFQQFVSEHQKMLEAYRAQNWSNAIEATERARRLPFTGLNPEPLLRVFEARISGFSLNPPGPGWDGVTKATEK